MSAQDTPLTDESDALQKVRALHHEWGMTELEDLDQLDLWERLGEILRGSR